MEVLYRMSLYIVKIKIKYNIFHNKFKIINKIKYKILISD